MTGLEDGLDMRVKGKASIKEYSQLSRKSFTLSGMIGEGADFMWGYIKEMNSSVPSTLNLQCLLGIQTEKFRQLDI